jgi:hypothetical protein
MGGMNRACTGRDFTRCGDIFRFCHDVCLEQKLGGSFTNRLSAESYPGAGTAHAYAILPDTFDTFVDRDSGFVCSKENGRNEDV